ncbi:LysM domain/BON superfamily protein [Maioricimonas rarisocia]|uniref:LysM domain/BON superfamily protein n=1 Tax=Maioricimonas rarisocia TaxID=2528026 RepID=A0A517Z6L7_9PLAN|nr:LysM peptidoglycan-binding domain-containing protein [Maioricimonas rarisocia]QDU38140.1 LysM domain/BON superfamily protein [Maioricimonas rarisocia]
MHSDQKLGIVLAILLIGFTAAFCFPRAPFNEAELLAVEEDLELDAEIQTLPVRAYTSLDRPRSSRKDAPAETITITREDGPDGGTGPETVAPPAIAVPSPVEIGFEVGGVDERPAPARNNTDREASTADAPSRDHNSDGATPPATYTVQYGDTLSGLAIRFLGTSRRYLDLYEANRDVLASPDDLRVGMTLRIPGGRAEQDASDDLEEALEAVESTREPDRSLDRGETAAEVRETSSPGRTASPSAAGRFRPAPRSPLTR